MFAAKKRKMQSADKTTIKTKVMHVYVSTTVLATDIQVVRFISYLDSDRDLMHYLFFLLRVAVIGLEPNNSPHAPPISVTPRITAAAYFKARYHSVISA